jgi:hypothetical protein
MKDDPIIAEIRRVRHRISEECGHDPDKIVERYMRIQEARESRACRATRESRRRSPAGNSFRGRAA